MTRIDRPYSYSNYVRLKLAWASGYVYIREYDILGVSDVGEGGKTAMVIACGGMSHCVEGTADEIMEKIYAGPFEDDED